jgi:hypothetical protein
VQQDNRARLRKTVEACVLAILLVAVITVGFYHAGLGAILGLLVGLFFVAIFQDYLGVELAACRSCLCRQLRRFTGLSSFSPLVCSARWLDSEAQSNSNAKDITDCCDDYVSERIAEKIDLSNKKQPPERCEADCKLGFLDERRPDSHKQDRKG